MDSWRLISFLQDSCGSILRGFLKNIFIVFWVLIILHFPLITQYLHLVNNYCDIIDYSFCCCFSFEKFWRLRWKFDLLFVLFGILTNPIRFFSILWNVKLFLQIHKDSIIYSNLMWAEAMMRSPANCQTWNSWTAKTPSTWLMSLRWMSSNWIWVGTVCRRIRADSWTIQSHKSESVVNSFSPKMNSPANLSIRMKTNTRLRNKSTLTPIPGFK